MLKKVVIFFCFYLSFFPLFNSVCFAASEKVVIKSAVAEGYLDGLHAKYLHYIADKLSVNLSLKTMPFARRVIEMRSGGLDIMVGLQRTEQRDDDFVYIFPHYESLSYRFFTLNEKHASVKSYRDLQGKYIGVNKWAKYFFPFDSDKNLKKYQVSNLEQNIKMLLHGRIEVFIHYEESTIPMLEALEVDHLITKTVYQPNHNNKHHVVISKSSSLMARIPELEAIIEQAVANGDFLKIRLDHYAGNN